MTLVTTLKVEIGHKATETVGGFSVSYNPAFTVSDSLASGVGLDQADKLYSQSAKTLAGSATVSLDVSGGLTDAFGATITMVKVKGLYIKNNSVVVGETLTIGGNANALLIFDLLGDTITIQPDGILFIYAPSLAGIPVTAATGDILDILNNSASATTYDIAIWGTSA